MLKEIRVSAPGKIHFLGEHAVVYGKPGLITAVGLRSTVSLIPNNENTCTITSKNLARTIIVSPEVILQRTRNARKKWQNYIDKNDISVLKSLTEDEMDYIVLAIGETLLFYKESMKTGFTLTVNSDIPLGAGLGSSAALAVAVITAVTVDLEKKVDKHIINDIAFLVEQKKHGLPSGGDNAAVCFGGLIWFRKESPDIKIIQPVPFTLPKKLAENFILIDTGRPAESTGEMVGYVRNLSKENPAVIEFFLNDQEILTRDLLSAIKEGKENEVMNIMKKGERNLEKIGVVSNSSKALIRTIESEGGAAKVCGASGRTKGTGILLAYHPKKTILKTLIQSKKLPYFIVPLGVEGVKIENYE